MKTKRKNKSKDCNEELIKQVGKIAIAIAIQDYRFGDMCKDPFEQIGRVLWIMQKQIIKRKKRKTKR